ncbi:MAG: UDP-glucose--hexose-1-phosphate uridylyltransferase [Clostridia bacterium]|nr:UDP-glucose--hexose-1-phosphate uridylyltransferase [Clostridia bacterium]
MIDTAIKQLVAYARANALIGAQDEIWAKNRLLEVLQRDSFDASPLTGDLPALEDILRVLLDDAADRGLIENDGTHRDLFDTRLMGAILPPPSEVIRRFYAAYDVSPQAATDFFYRFSRDTDYIRRYRVKRDLKWKADTDYGALDITVNLSKPEKSPEEIAAAKKAKQGGYPKCLLCPENEGYAGRVNHPARQNHRIIPITVGGSEWGFQYSPYVYYNEHCIVFNKQHIPMKIDRSAFEKLLDFVTLFPHYFVGSNADLPIVGGSILSHEHFQGGHYDFAMAKAPVETTFFVPGFDAVRCGIVKWPMSVIRLTSDDRRQLTNLADKILCAWRAYSDPQCFIFAETDGEPHNTITPIARRRGEAYELDLVLRNNITTDEHPLGVFHPHSELHHIKKENIGLIEVMGLAVLPARLKTEMAALETALLTGADLSADPVLEKHAAWADDLRARYEFTEENVHAILQKEIGAVFALVLEHAGVFKRDTAGKAGFDRFIRRICE